MKYFLGPALFIVLSGCLSGTLEGSYTPPDKKEEKGNTTNPNNITPSIACIPDATHFNRYVNTMMEGLCISCHRTGGNAEKSTFLLEEAGGFSDYLERNLAASTALAKQKNPDFGDRSNLILKPMEIVEHGGGKFLKEGADDTKILEEFINRVDNPTDCGDQEPETPFLEGVQHLDKYGQLRRASLLLGGRLPTPEEIKSVESTETGLDDIYDQLMTEDAFFSFIERGWNDILHIRGVEFPRSSIDGGAFPAKAWWDLLPETTPEEKKIKYNINRNRTMFGLRQGPIKLISYIVRENRPFTEIVTADYAMVNYYSAKAYLGKKVGAKLDLATADFSLADALPFKNREDLNEFHPVSFLGGGSSGIPADEKYYHVGILSDSVLWQKYPSTPTNKNRTRSRVFFKTFLDTNILELAPRAGDADLVVNYTNPTKDFSQCNVCHTQMDPVAGLFQAISNGGYRKPFVDWDPSYTPGIGNKLLPASRVNDPERWLGEQTAIDPRFPISMVANGLFILTGKERITAPGNTADPYFVEHLRAFEEQRNEIRRISALFVNDNFNFKTILKEWLKSPLLTAISTDETLTAKREAALIEIGFANLLSPEDLNRKIKAIFGRIWTTPNGVPLLSERESKRKNGTVRYDDLDYAAFYYLYDGIDSRELTKRLKNPNGVNGAVMKLIAEDVASQNTAFDLAQPIEKRLLFGDIDRLSTDETDIRKTLVGLFERVLGQRFDVTAPEIDRAFKLWTAVQKDGVTHMEEEGYSKTLVITSNTAADKATIVAAIPDDATYTVRAWQAVMVYLLSDYHFFFE